MTDTFKQIQYITGEEDSIYPVPVLCEYLTKDDTHFTYTEIKTKKIPLEIPENWNIDKIFLLLQKYQKELEDG